MLTVSTGFTESSTHAGRKPLLRAFLPVHSDPYKGGASCIFDRASLAFFSESGYFAARKSYFAFAFCHFGISASLGKNYDLNSDVIVNRVVFCEVPKDRKRVCVVLDRRLETVFVISLDPHKSGERIDLYSEKREYLLFVGVCKVCSLLDLYGYAVLFQNVVYFMSYKVERIVV